MLVFVAGGSLSVQDAAAQSYTNLQVLLPGESPAPGTGTGKSGAPVSQTVGVPFTVTVRACDASWNLVTTITNSVSLTSADASASLPSSFSLAGGTATVQVTLNAAGSFTFSADDGSDPTIPLATSSSVSSYLLQGFEFSRITQKNQYAGQAMSTTITAVDPNGSTVPYNGPISLNEVTSYGDGRISPATVTLSGGTWSGSVTMYRADETSINRGNVNMFAYLQPPAGDRARPGSPAGQRGGFPRNTGVADGGRWLRGGCVRDGRLLESGCERRQRAHHIQ
jgi:hypothetical protein